MRRKFKFAQPVHVPRSKRSKSEDAAGWRKHVPLAIMCGIIVGAGVWWRWWGAPAATQWFMQTLGLKPFGGA